MSAAPATTNKPAAAITPTHRLDAAEKSLIGRLLNLGLRGKAQADYERVFDCPSE
jgi:hypothetical protein